MLLKKIILENFRNHSLSEYNFSDGMTLFLGENGIGKTNIVEAIFSLSTTKAFRANKKEVFISHKKDFGKVQGVTSHEQLEIFWGINPKKNIYKKNDIIYTPSEFIREKKFLAVLFSPEDMNLPILPPLQRRRFLSRILAPLFPEYFDASLKYDAVLKHRNELLKKFADNKSTKKEFFFWDNELIIYHEVIQQYRSQFFTTINAQISELYEQITGKKESVQIIFTPSCAEESKNFKKVLEENFEKDVFQRRTTAGSHRDDFQLLLRGISLQEGASRGETRSVILALKMAEKNFVATIAQSKPILLLDDVFSELDTNHQKHLLESIQDHQVVITTTHSEIDIERFGAKVYEL